MNVPWPLVPLREILIPANRPETIDPEKSYHILGAHWYAKGLYTKDIRSGSQIQAKNLYRVEEGDFVYNRLFAWKGSFAVASEENHGCYVSNEFPCFVINEDRVDGQYLWRYFSRAGIWEEAFGLSTGGTPTSRNRLEEGKFLAMKMPLPPMKEQRRIVAKIDKLAAKIEEAGGLRKRSVVEVERLISSVSKYFFSAKDLENSTRLEFLTSRITKGESPEWQGFTYQESGPFFVRSENVLWGRFDKSKQVRIPIEFHEKLNRSQLHRGDVLINLVGASIGRSCIVPGDICEANVNQAVAVISPDEKQLDSKFLMYFLISQSAQEKIHGGKVETARPNISLTDLRNLLIPFYSLPKQKRIVEYLDGLQAKVDALKKHQAQTVGELDALLPSILDKAFKGDL
jgi:type I restriction enzyme S subunit